MNDCGVRASEWRRLEREREQLFPNEASDARFNAVAASDEGKKLLDAMHKPEGSDSDRYNERTLEDSKTLFHHLVERLRLEPKWTGHSEMAVSEWAMTKHPQGKVWYDTWKHQEDLKRREELAAKQKQEAPHLYQ